MHIIAMEQGRMYEMEGTIRYGKYIPRCHVGKKCQNAYEISCVYCKKSACGQHRSKKYPLYCTECAKNPKIYKEGYAHLKR